MHRRGFLRLGCGLAGLAGAQQKEEVTATASQDKTPRAGIVLSSFRGSSDHDGAPIQGLPDPRPTDADLTGAQVDAMVRKAIELGNTRQGGLASLIGADDWVVIKPNIVTCYGQADFNPGMVTDPRIVRSLIAWLVEHKCGGRITIAEGAGQWMPAARAQTATDGWTTDWGGAFGGCSYKLIVDEFSKGHPGIRFEIVDLNFHESAELPAPQNPHRVYHVPNVIQRCDRLISVTPFKTNSGTGVSLAMKNYVGIAPGAKYGFPKKALHRLGPIEEIVVDLFSFHPADYAILGGCWGAEAEGSPVHHNLIVAGANAVAVDAVGATLMGFRPADLAFLRLAWRRGFGIHDVDAIWTRGNTIEEARRRFRKA